MGWGMETENDLIPMNVCDSVGYRLAIFTDFISPQYVIGLGTQSCEPRFPVRFCSDFRAASLNVVFLAEKLDKPFAICYNIKR